MIGWFVSILVAFLVALVIFMFICGVSTTSCGHGSGSSIVVSFVIALVIVRRVRAWINAKDNSK